MQRIDHTSNIPFASGAPAVEATVSPGFFRRPSALLGNQGTVVTADWLNDIQEELATVISTNGQTLAKGSNALLLAAIESQIDGNVTTHAGLISNESVLGHLEVATAAEAAALTNNARAITPHNLTDTFEVGSNANGNYCYLPTAIPGASRVVAQWGVYVDAGSTDTGTIPLAVTMSNALYYAGANDPTTRPPNKLVGPASATAINYSISNWAGTTLHWFAFGLSA